MSYTGNILGTSLMVLSTRPQGCGKDRKEYHQAVEIKSDFLTSPCKGRQGKDRCLEAGGQQGPLGLHRAFCRSGGGRC